MATQVNSATGQVVAPVAPTGQPGAAQPGTTPAPASSVYPTNYDAGAASGGGLLQDIGGIYASLVGKVSANISSINNQMIGLVNSNGGQLDAGTAAMFSSRIQEQSNTLEFLKKMSDEKERGMRAWLQ
jgi:hypothetical protein